jgi:DNA-binding MarR family transcriptional regulator
LKRSPKSRPAAASIQEQEFALAEGNRCNSLSLRKAARNVSAFYDGVLAPTGLRATQRAVLMNIAREGRPTVQQLASKLRQDRTTLSRALRPLLRRKLIALSPDKKDKRVRFVVLTKKGDEKLRQTLHLWRVAQDRFETVFGKDQSRALRETLEKIAALDFAGKGPP